MKLQIEVQKLTSGYCRKGGKTNRRQQQKRMLKFAEFAERFGARSIHQVGARHVIAYWKHTRHLSTSTRYNHWRALCVLWHLSEKNGPPPPPYSANMNSDSYS